MKRIIFALVLALSVATLVGCGGTTTSTGGGAPKASSPTK
jgi:hypothetical protein